MKKSREYWNLEIRIENALVHLFIWGTVLFLILCWNRIPEEIPMHYGMDGAVDSYGDKSGILLVLFLDFYVYAMHFFVLYITPAMTDAKQLYGQKMERLVTREDRMAGIRDVLCMIGRLDAVLLGWVSLMTYWMASCRALPGGVTAALVAGIAAIICAWGVQYIRRKTQYREDNIREEI